MLGHLFRSGRGLNPLNAFGGRMRPPNAEQPSIRQVIVSFGYTNGFCSASKRSVVISASRVVPRRRTM